MCTRPISSRGDRFSSLCDYLFDESKSTAGTLRRGVVIVRDIESSFCVFFFLPRPTSRAPTGPRFAEDTGFRAKPYHLTGRSNLVKTAAFGEQGYVTSRVSNCWRCSVQWKARKLRSTLLCILKGLWEKGYILSMVMFRFSC